MGAIKKPSTSNYDRFIAWCEKYKYPMMAMHFGFIAISCALVCGMAALVHIQKRQEDGVSYTSPSILMTAIYSGISTFGWLFPTVFCASKSLDRANQNVWDHLGVKQKARFWFWFLAMNSTSLIMWSVITTLFWDVTWVCWIGKGEGAELNPYEGGLCNQLTNIWFYAIFVVLAIFVNLYLVVDEQLNIHFTKGEDNEIDEMNLVDHPYKDITATSQESAPIRTQPKLML
ncbi:UNVERIFIED_CONTAM: hypothetical protein HDU68_011917 [Siphonaria sp. JEL0065]|nr:hypothetical protein HDU68_011917 [Siphonaria sp. JEL0065]